MGNLNFGYNFEPETLGLIEELNNLHSKENPTNRITSVYGSDVEHSYLSARPDYRFPRFATLNNLFAHAKMLRDIGVGFWYTANTIDIGAKFAINKSRIAKWIDELSTNDIGIIVADTMLLEIINKHCKVTPRVELSTIMRIESPRELIALKEQYPFIVKSVIHISYNRSFYLLKQFVKAADIAGIELEVLVNENCGTGYPGGASPCIHRDSCYNNHGHNVTLQDAKLISDYPLNKCISKRYSDITNFLNLFWILPEHFKYYEAIGIHYFKVTGRTASADFAKDILPKYVRGLYDGNIINSWLPIEKINRPGTGHSQDRAQGIDSNTLYSFMLPFVEEEIECHSRICNVDCDYCQEYYNDIISDR